MRGRRIQLSVVCGVVMVMVVMMSLVGCSWFERDRDDSPTGPTGSALKLGQYAQQPGLSRVVTVNGATHQINGVVAGHPFGELYIEINEQDGTGYAPGEHQVAVSLRDVKLGFSGLPTGVSALQVLSNDIEIGQYVVVDGGVEIALTRAQWMQWFGPTHYAVVCKAVGNGTLNNAAVAIAGTLPDGTAVALGQGFASGATGGGACPPCPPCPPGTCDPNDLPAFVDNGNGTISDTHTGLVWLQDANCNLAMNWTDAGNWAAGLADGQCGLTDESSAGQWRLPTVEELHDLIDYTNYYPALPAGHPFTNVQNSYYWTSTNYAPASSAAWSVGMAYGRVLAYSKTNTYSAWAVR